MPKDEKPIGITGVNISGGYVHEDLNPVFNEAQRHDIFKRMYTDGTVFMVTQALMQPLLAADWYVGSENEDLKKELSVMLGLEENEGTFKGMKFQTWQHNLQQALVAIRHGYMLLEKVRDIYEGKIIYRKLASRLPQSVLRWIVDENEFKQRFPQKDLPQSSFYAIEQSGYDGSSYKSGIIIPRDKLIHINLFPTGENPEGYSLYRAIYEHWYFKTELMKIDGIRQEKQAVGVPFAQYDPAQVSEAQRNDLAVMLQEMRVNEKGFVMYPTGISEIGFMDTKPANTNLLDSIEFHDRKIAQTLMAQALLLGSTASGSRAVADSQFGFFNYFIISIGKYIAQAFTNDLIEEYKQLNPKYKNVEAYLDFSGIQKENYDEIIKQINESIKVGSLTKDDLVEKKVREIVGIETLEEVENEKPEKEEVPKEENDKEEMPDDAAKATIKMYEPWRKLTMAEQAVDFKKIDSDLNKYELKFKTDLQGSVEDAITMLLAKAEKLISKKDFLGLRNLTVNMAPAIRNTIYTTLNDIYNIGIREASKELKVLRAPTSTEAKQYNRLISDIAINDLTTELVSETQKASLESLRGNKTPAQAVFDMKQEIVKKKDSFVQDLAALSIVSAFNRGRGQVFQKNEADIYAYEWSAILDSRTCKFCMRMDGRVFDANDPMIDRGVPAHSNCRCVFVPVLKTQAEKPEITGMPAKTDFNGVNDFEMKMNEKLNELLS